MSTLNSTPLSRVERNERQERSLSPENEIFGAFGAGATSFRGNPENKHQSSLGAFLYDKG